MQSAERKTSKRSRQTLFRGFCSHTNQLLSIRRIPRRETNLGQFRLKRTPFIIWQGSPEVNPSVPISSYWAGWWRRSETRGTTRSGCVTQTSFLFSTRPDPSLSLNMETRSHQEASKSTPLHCLNVEYMTEGWLYMVWSVSRLFFIWFSCPFRNPPPEYNFLQIMNKEVHRYFVLTLKKRWLK